MKNNQIIKNITILAFLTSILFVQEQILQFIPNIQLTIFLIILYAKKLKLKNTIIIILIHTILDNIFYSTFHLIPIMFIGWMIIALGIYIFFKKIENPIILALYSIIGSLIYSSIFMIYNIITIKINFLSYIIADIPFTIILSISSFLSVMWLYQPLKQLMDKFLKQGEI